MPRLPVTKGRQPYCLIVLLAADLCAYLQMARSKYSGHVSLATRPLVAEDSNLTSHSPNASFPAACCGRVRLPEARMKKLKKQKRIGTAARAI